MRRGRDAAFTLVEVIVTLGLIALLSLAATIHTRSADEGPRLRGSERMFGTLIQNARIYAMLFQTETRVIIADDSADPQTYRQVIGIVSRDTGDSNRWSPHGRSVRFPVGVYTWLERGDELPLMKLQYPLRLSDREGEGIRWRYIGFFETGIALNPGSLVVIGAPARSIGGNPGNSDFEDGRGARGFRISRFGDIVASDWITSDDKKSD